ncbi:hypothetical protein RRG08_004133 [Elysia crispata]|uniref:Uncharacterized protein n=1 Tax=Elysia crispata TaxID=231223 RepID=A0AAE1D5R1_9GAST|nr:hypothetical protein RRG08_004133 [Elysia crispata]
MVYLILFRTCFRQRRIARDNMPGVVYGCRDARFTETKQKRRHLEDLSHSLRKMDTPQSDFGVLSFWMKHSQFSHWPILCVFTALIKAHALRPGQVRIHPAPSPNAFGSNPAVAPPTRSVRFSLLSTVLIPGTKLSVADPEKDTGRHGGRRMGDNLAALH